MSELISSDGKTNWLLSLSLKRPVLVMLILYILACLIKILDSFVLRLDELLGEAILTKALGFVLVACMSGLVAENCVILVSIPATWQNPCLSRQWVLSSSIFWRMECRWSCCGQLEKRPALYYHQSIQKQACREGLCLRFGCWWQTWSIPRWKRGSSEGQ